MVLRSEISKCHGNITHTKIRKILFYFWFYVQKYSRKNWPEKIIFPKTHFLHFVTRWRKIFKTILFILPEVHIHIHVEIQLKVSIFRFLYLGSIRKLRCFFITGHSSSSKVSSLNSSSSSKVSSLNSSVGFLSCRIDFFLAEPLTPDDPLLNSHLGWGKKEGIRIEKWIEIEEINLRHKHYLGS